VFYYSGGAFGSFVAADKRTRRKNRAVIILWGIVETNGKKKKQHATSLCHTSLVLAVAS
jgi:hypothetical protein